jgi:hypothetical protein
MHLLTTTFVSLPSFSDASTGNCVKTLLFLFFVFFARAWWLKVHSPQLDPFIIMDHVNATLSSTFLKQPDQEDPFLNQDIDNTTSDKVCYQIAHYMFQLSRPNTHKDWCPSSFCAFDFKELC